MVKISIITATYNSGATLRQAIESVVKQTYENIEYIIIDGGSSDDTIDVIKEYSDRISYWISEPDNGIYDAFNKGIRIATGDYIYFLGSDDALCEVDSIKKTIPFLEKGVDFFSAGVYTVDEEEGLQCIRTGIGVEDKGRYQGGMIPHQGFLVKLNVANRLSFDTKYKIAADYKFFLQCYLDENMTGCYVNFPIAFYSLGGISERKNKETIGEIINIEKELGLNYLEKKRNSLFFYFRSSLREMIKGSLRLMGIFYHVRRVIRTRCLGWELHKCDWENCRWCGLK